MGNFLVGVALVIKSSIDLGIDWTPSKLLVLVVGVLSGGFIFIGLNLITCVAAFWIVDSVPVTRLVFDNHLFAQYPLTIYPKAISILLTQFTLRAALPILYGQAGVQNYLGAYLQVGMPLASLWMVLVIWAFARRAPSNFVPIVLGNGKIQLEVRPEVSELDYANGTTISGTTVPGFKSRSADIRHAALKNVIFTVARGRNGSLNIEPVLSAMQTMKDSSPARVGAPSGGGPGGGGPPAVMTWQEEVSKEGAKFKEQGLQYSGPRTVVESQSTLNTFRKVPMSRLAIKLDLLAYMDLHPEFAGDVQPAAVRIPLRQHIGAPALACVRVGDTVRAGDCIGEIPEGALGARVHASIAGVVTEVGSSISIKGT